MPQLLRFGPYRVYFWSNEGLPLEPVHVFPMECHMQMQPKYG